MPPPAKGAVLTKKDTVALIAALKKSEASKSQCGKRLIAYYETIREGLK